MGNEHTSGEAASVGAVDAEMADEDGIPLIELSPCSTGCATGPSPCNDHDMALDNHVGDAGQIVAGEHCNNVNQIARDTTKHR